MMIGFIEFWGVLFKIPFSFVFFSFCIFLRGLWKYMSIVICYLYSRGYLVWRYKEHLLWLHQLYRLLIVWLLDHLREIHSYHLSVDKLNNLRLLLMLMHTVVMLRFHGWHYRVHRVRPHAREQHLRDLRSVVVKLRQGTLRKSLSVHDYLFWNKQLPGVKSIRGFWFILSPCFYGEWWSLHILLVAVVYDVSNSIKLRQSYLHLGDSLRDHIQALIGILLAQPLLLGGIHLQERLLTQERTA